LWLTTDRQRLVPVAARHELHRRAVPARPGAHQHQRATFFTPNWPLIVKFNGEFASASQTYAGPGTLRYTW